MDITPHLSSKFRMLSGVKNVYVNNLYHHIDSKLHSTILFVFDANVSHIIADYTNTHTKLLCLRGNNSGNNSKRALPTFKNVAIVEEAISKEKPNFIFGFGTGAINDICKLASHNTKTPYTFCPTALSMNGISSQNVSIFDEEKNIKTSIQASSPSSIILQPDILSEAPMQFIGSSIMDSLSAYTACNDFIYASQVNPKLYRYEKEVFSAFNITMQVVLEIINQRSAEAFSQEENLLCVFEMLYFSGLIMNHYKSSIAFSGGEHAIAHTIEAKFPEISYQCLHGEVISAILPFYAQLQRNYTGECYTDRQTVLENTSINFTKIAEFFNLPTSPKFFEQFGVSEIDFHNCVKNAKFAKERPTLLNLLF